MKNPYIEFHLSRRSKINSMREVQAISMDIQLTDDQEMNLVRMRNELNQQLVAYSEQADELSDSIDRDTQWKKLKAKFEPRIDKLIAEFEAEFLPHQIQRMRQLETQKKYYPQQDSTFALIRMKDELNLTDEQISAIKEKAIKLEKELRVKSAELQKELIELRVEARKSILKELSGEQKSKYENMIGDELMLSKSLSRWFGYEERVRAATIRKKIEMEKEGKEPDKKKRDK